MSVVTADSNETDVRRGFKAAQRHADALRVVHAPAGIVLAALNAEDESGPLFQAIEIIADRYFARDSARVDFEAVLIEASVGQPASARTSELADAYNDTLEAHQLAAFALGVAWGRREGR